MTLHQVTTFFIKLIGYLIFKISCLFPRNKKKWLLGDIMGFSGNTKYWLPELIEKNKKHNFNLIWITHQKQLLEQIKRAGIKAYYWLHPIAIWHCLTAGVYITTDCTKDINCYLSGRAFYVTLWHGVSLKVAGRLTKIYLNVPENKRNNFYYHVLFFYWIYRTPDLCLTTSQFQLHNYFMPMFGLPEEKFMLGMFPRNKWLLKSKDELKTKLSNENNNDILTFIDNLEKYNKVYIYMPTWRDDNNDILETTQIDFDKLNKILKSKNELLLVKLHIGSHTKYNFESEFSNITAINKHFDTYSILPFTHTLITDYSSIYSDYILMNKEVIIFDFDKEHYLSKDRGLLFDFDEYTLGKRAHNATELLEIIGNGEDCHLSENDMHKMLEIYWSARDNHLDIFEEIRSRLFK